MNKIKKGSIVKFHDADGRLNGGTVVDFTRKDNEDYALINALEGEKIVKKKSELTLIVRQQRGRVPANFMNNLKEEIRIENEEKVISHLKLVSDETPDSITVKEEVLVERLKTLLSQKDAIIKTQSDTISLLNERIAKFVKEKLPLNQNNLILTVKGLSDALLASSINNEADMVQELINVIGKLNGIIP